MTEPRELVAAIEEWPRLPGGLDERFAGWGVFGLPFAAGHILALRRFPASSVGPGFTSVWHRNPDGRWIFYTDVEPLVGCPRYFGSALTETVATPIGISWIGPRRFAVTTGDGAVDWEVTLSATAATRALNAVGGVLPGPLWRWGPVRSAAGGIVGRTMRAGRVVLAGTVPNGQRFAVNPRFVWAIPESRAVVGGADLGPPGPLLEQARLADFWLPQTGLFVIGRVFLEASDVGRHRADVRGAVSRPSVAIAGAPAGAAAGGHLEDGARRTHPRQAGDRGARRGAPVAGGRTSLRPPHGGLRLVDGEAGDVPDGARGVARLGPMALEGGGRMAEVELAYRTWGRLNPAGDNAVLLLHALTGDARAAGQGGWWEPLVGPSRAIDTDRAFVVCANVLGGCAGSTGPASLDPTTGGPYAMGFPLVTIGDMVSAQRRLVEQLGVTRLVAVGGSMGGFQALEWATRHPDLVGGTVAIAAADRMGAQAIALHGEVGRRAIMADPAWHAGNYQRVGAFPAAGLAVARMAAMVTYQSRESMAERFGRAQATRPSPYPSFGGTFAIEGYLHHHGEALVGRFDANSYLYLTRAMDRYDLGRAGGLDRWLRRLAAPLLLVGIGTDWLFPPDEIRALARHAAALGAEATYAELDSIAGHDAFLKEWGQLEGLLRPVVGRALTTMPDQAGNLARAG